MQEILQQENGDLGFRPECRGPEGIPPRRALATGIFAACI
jgi:hypothetical protein